MAKTSINSTSKPSVVQKKKQPSVKRRVLAAIASQRAFGKQQVEKDEVLRLAFIPNKHTFDTNCATLKKKGWIEQTGTCLVLTEEGLAQVGEDAIAIPQTNDDMQAKLKEQIKVKKAHAIFDVLTDGRAYDRSEIAEKLGMDEKTKTFKTYMSYLSKVVDKLDGGKAQLKDIAFPFGRPCDRED